MKSSVSPDEPAETWIIIRNVSNINNLVALDFFICDISQCKNQRPLVDSLCNSNQLPWALTLFYLWWLQIPALPVYPVCVSSGVDRRRRPLLERTRPFVLVDGQRRSLTEALQVRRMKPQICNRSKVRMMSLLWGRRRTAIRNKIFDLWCALVLFQLSVRVLLSFTVVPSDTREYLVQTDGWCCFDVTALCEGLRVRVSRTWCHVAPVCSTRSEHCAGLFKKAFWMLC